MQVANATMQKTVGDLTNEEFRILDELARANLISGDLNYLKKAQRLQYMAIPDGNGALVDANWNPVDAQDYPYAMDRYGNLFTRNQAPLNGAWWFNHSSFNAGQEVISAGIIRINGGTLEMIDNNSGHYKPSRQNLHDCLVVLTSEGVDLQNAIVNLYVWVNGVKQEHRYNATTFRADPNQPPDIHII